MLGAHHCFRGWGARERNQSTRARYLGVSLTQGKLSSGLLKQGVVTCHSVVATGAQQRLSTPTLARLPPRQSSVSVEVVVGHRGCLLWGTGGQS